MSFEQLILCLFKQITNFSSISLFDYTQNSLMIYQIEGVFMKKTLFLMGLIASSTAFCAQPLSDSEMSQIGMNFNNPAITHGDVVKQTVYEYERKSSQNATTPLNLSTQVAKAALVPVASATLLPGILLNGLPGLPGLGGAGLLGSLPNGGSNNSNNNTSPFSPITLPNLPGGKKGG